MKKTHVIVMILMVLVSTVVYSQNATADPVERAATITEWMKTNLSLDENQLTQVQAINLEYAQKNQELQGTSLTRKQKMEAFKANEAARDAKLNQVLTPEQMKIYDSKKSELKKQMKEKMKNAKKEGAPAGG